MTRLCIDTLGAARNRLTDYVGPWLPEPLIQDTADSPESLKELADDLSTLQPEQPVEAHVSLGSGKMLRGYVEALPSQRSWRLFIDFEPEGKKPVDMRAILALRGVPLTETFATVHRP